MIIIIVVASENLYNTGEKGERVLKKFVHTGKRGYTREKRERVTLKERRSGCALKFPGKLLGEAAAAAAFFRPTFDISAESRGRGKKAAACRILSLSLSFMLAYSRAELFLPCQFRLSPAQSRATGFALARAPMCWHRHIHTYIQSHSRLSRVYENP